MLLKVAILREFIHIFVPYGTRRGLYRCCQCLIWFLLLFYPAMVVFANVQCSPHRKIYDLSVKGHCFNRRALDITVSFVTLLTDFAILLLPQLAIWKLQMPRVRKIGLSAIFAVGIVAVVSAVVRIPSAIRFFESADTTYDYSSVNLWALVEITCGVIIICAPTAPKLYESLRNWKGLAAPKSSQNPRDPEGNGQTRTCNFSLRRTLPLAEEQPDSQTRGDSEKPENADNRRMAALDNLDTSKVSRNDKLRILRTTHFTTSEEHVESGANDSHHLQHPWMSEPSTCEGCITRRIDKAG